MGSCKGENVEQGALRLQTKVEDVSEATILRCKDMRSAIRLCCEASGLHLKEIAFPLDLQENHLSRMISSDGDRHFPPHLIDRLMDVCGNEIPLKWLARIRNYELRKLQSAIEIELEAERRGREEDRKKIELLMEIMKVNGR